ncbi:hypothetical protein V7S43_018701 [Phytophthora oleae]|uniref:Uncharacterized protein n=1 Tax=Phytophthora oleae TaxID=2107226 RepID=A0ABD3EPW9_9STRA
MEPLGGCTRKKKIFWREEEKQVASILLERWFREPSDDSSNDKSVVVGSPGIGKSTMLILMAFYLVLKHKKNVLVYRWLDKVEGCSPELVVAIYEELGKHQGFSNVWLLLDKLDYERIPPGLNTFRLLATSENAEATSRDLDEAYLCLLPCWKKHDLFKLGRKVYNFEEKNMEDRLYFSGGSVRVFTKETRNPLKDMRFAISNACMKLKDLSALFPEVRVVQGDQIHFDRLRHIFLKDNQDPSRYLFRSNWENIIDSEYAVLLLSQTLRLDELVRSLHWALKAGHDTLAGTVSAICLHRLAVDNDLILNVSKCTPCKQNKKRKMDRIRLEMKEGDAFCSDTATKDGYDEDELKEWRDDDQLSYWYPYCDDIPNIDGIVKLKPSSPDKKSRVAFLHLTVGHQHAVDDNLLKTLKKLFTAEDFDPPIYVALCPYLDSSDNIVVKPGSQGVKAKGSCQVFVGYYDEPPLECNDDDWRYTVTHKEEKPIERYDLPPSKEWPLN